MARKAPLPPTEAARLESLRSYEILDTPPDLFFDQITALAAELCEVPIALVSLVDEDRQWFKSTVGLDAVQTPRDVSFCAHAILTPDELLEVRDATLDERFVGNPLVAGAPGIRFYAGAPLVNPEGHSLGTLCVIDRQPRSLSEPQRAALRGLGRAVATQLELHRTAGGLRDALQRAERSRHLLSAQQAAMKVLMSNRSPTAGANDLATAIGVNLDAVACALWLRNGAAAELQCMGAWVKHPAQDPFLEASRGRTLREGEGLPGRVLKTGASSTIPDLEADGNFPRHLVARACGIVAGCAVPIVGEAGVLGALEVFSAAPGAPDDERRLTLEMLGHQVGLAFERERAQAEVARTHARTRAIVDTALDCVISIDAAGLVREYNPAAQQTFGWTREQALGQPLHALIIPPRFRDAHVAGMSRYRSTNQAKVVGKRIEISAARADGSEFPVELALSRMPGETFEVTAFLRDITERVEAQKALQAAKEDAEAASRSKSEFLANMSHEIRTPLNAILGMTELALDGETHADQRDLLGTAHSNAESLLGLVNAILDDSKIAAGLMEVHLQPSATGDVLESVAEALSARAASAGLQLVCDVDPALPPELLADPHRLRQVLLNLASNAVKFTAKGSVVLSVTVDRTDPESVDAHFRVRDSGPGISPAALERIFERFFQSDALSAQRPGGTGLGLSISRALVALMGGRIWAESEVGHGTVLHVVIPMKRVAPSLPRNRVSDRLFRGARAILVSPPGDDRVALQHAFSHFEVETLLADDVAGLRELALADGDVVVLAEALGAASVTAAAHWVNATGRLLHLCLSGPPLGGASATAPPGFELLSRPVVRRRLGALLARLLDPEGRRPARATTGPAEAPAHLLVVDDHQDNLTFVTRVLERLGHRVEVARNGEEAFARARAWHFDMVLTDLEMPLMDGYAFARALRAFERSRGDEPTPIVACSAHVLSGVSARCLAAGMNDSISKPVRAAKLRSKVSQWADLRPVVLVADAAEDCRASVRRVLLPESYRLVFARTGAEALAEFARHRVAAVLLEMSTPAMDGPATARALRELARGTAVPIVGLSPAGHADEAARCLAAGCTAFLAKPLEEERTRRVVQDLVASVARDAGPPAPGTAARTSDAVLVDADIADLIPGYLEARHEDVKTIRERLAAGDFPAVAAVGHHLAGSGGSYGFALISELGARLERAARAAEHGEVERCLADLEAYLLHLSWAPRGPPA